MRKTNRYFFPLAIPFVLAFLLVLLLLIAFVEIGALGYAFEKLGVDPRYVTTLLVLSLLGSYVNVPVAELPPEQVRSGELVSFFGMRYVVPVVRERPRTVVAVNLGGAVVPVLLSLYLLLKTGMYVRSFAAIAVVTAAVHRLARPVPGVGIAVPMLVPPLLAAATALLLSQNAAPTLAYLSGTLGTLIGADLFNLHKLRGLGAPVASIGGAGTFDGIFLTGIVAVLLA